MVQNTDPNQATHAQDLTVDGCVCPQCFKPLKAPVVTDGGGDRYGRHVRSYAGMCFECRQACRVVQFERDGKWLIHSYLPHRYESGKFVGIGDWIVVNPLPEPAAVVFGPGGDYDKTPDLSGDLAISIIHTLSTISRTTTNAIGELLKAIEKLQHNEPNNRQH